MNLRLYRLQKNYSQEYIAFKLGISQKAYSKIEAGTTELTVKRLLEISSILELDVVDILSPTIQALTADNSYFQKAT